MKASIKITSSSFRTNASSKEEYCWVVVKALHHDHNIIQEQAFKVIGTIPLLCRGDIIELPNVHSNEILACDLNTNQVDHIQTDSLPNFMNYQGQITGISEGKLEIDNSVILLHNLTFEDRHRNQQIVLINVKLISQASKTVFLQCPLISRLYIEEITVPLNEPHGTWLSIANHTIWISSQAQIAQQLKGLVSSTMLTNRDQFLGLGGRIQASFISQSFDIIQELKRHLNDTSNDYSCRLCSQKSQMGPFLNINQVADHDGGMVLGILDVCPLTARPILKQSSNSAYLATHREKFTLGFDYLVVATDAQFDTSFSQFGLATMTFKHLHYISQVTRAANTLPPMTFLFIVKALPISVPVSKEEILLQPVEGYIFGRLKGNSNKIEMEAQQTRSIMISAQWARKIDLQVGDILALQPSTGMITEFWKILFQLNTRLDHKEIVIPPQVTTRAITIECSPIAYKYLMESQRVLRAFITPSTPQPLPSPIDYRNLHRCLQGCIVEWNWMGAAALNLPEPHRVAPFPGRISGIKYLAIELECHYSHCSLILPPGYLIPVGIHQGALFQITHVHMKRSEITGGLMLLPSGKTCITYEGAKALPWAWPWHFVDELQPAMFGKLTARLMAVKRFCSYREVGKRPIWDISVMIFDGSAEVEGLVNDITIFKSVEGIKPEGLELDAQKQNFQYDSTSIDINKRLKSPINFNSHHFYHMWARVMPSANLDKKANNLLIVRIYQIERVDCLEECQNFTCLYQQLDQILQLREQSSTREK